ncbi:COG complex component [Fistulina hepatica ATCC 64428]|uniref:Conserved oligomeric Golgi complex subunit 2 n=1 Tax=Fistulina hepatica ATCC 64428 TaxID=1128425 RepID=A0A0D7A8R3_9AGAR|nr:COG complex component [Fistulina hepatica ATCC 64428]
MQNDPRDPYDLNRLAEELEIRERNVSSDVPVSHDLPESVPLSHGNPFLTAKTFDVEEFLLSRSHTSLFDLRAQLRDYLSSLKEELVQLINDDYEAFISLHTDLKGEGVRLDRLKSPLGYIRDEILTSKSELQAIQDTIQEQLSKRAKLREEKALLHLLLKISDSTTRLESLLLITPSSVAEDERVPGVPSSLNTYEDRPEHRRNRANQAKHLGRVATEYIQLLYHASKARASKCAFVDEIQWRIDRIHSTLSSDLDHLFASIVAALADEKSGEGRMSELEKSKWTSDLAECLRSYDTLGLWRDAEDILKREVVRGYIRKTIYPGTLNVPHTPLMPHTPFVATTARPSFPPKTPFTPFTAFQPKNNPLISGFDRGAASNSPYARFLEESEDPLAKLFLQVLRFVERDLCRVMDIAEKVSAKSMSAHNVRHASQLTLSFETPAFGFEILANVIWAELGSAIMEELGTVVFAAGQPDEFRLHYETTHAFVRALEFLAPSERAVVAMRAHPVYTAFEKRWQLPVYFQMRWKEIVGKLENVMASPDTQASQDNDGFVKPQTAATWEAICACWNVEVYIAELGSRFWRLTLQVRSRDLLSRYKTCVEQHLAAIDGVPLRSANPPNDRPRTSTLVSGVETPSTENIAADDALLRQYAIVIVDIRELESQVRGKWLEEISVMLPEVSDEGCRAEDALSASLSALRDLVVPLSMRITTILTKRCCEALSPVRSIPSQFRAMSNKKAPSEPSYFVFTILRPLKAFFGINTVDGPGARLKEFVLPYSQEVFGNVSERYGYYLVAMKKTEESLRRIKKGKKSSFSLFGSSNTKEDDGQDEERIRSQMIIDVSAFGREGESLGIDTAESPAFQSLLELANGMDTS